MDLGRIMKRLYRALTLDETTEHRLDDCENYDDCLYMAAIKKYKSFSCRNCDNYELSTERLPILAMSNTPEYVYDSTKFEDGGSIADFCKELMTKMREMGITEGD